jgi:hypothetical protein
MKVHKTLRIFGYILVYSTPIPLAFLAWILYFVYSHSGEYTLMSLSLNDFFEAKLPSFRNWIFSVLKPIDFVLEWVWQFPAAVLIALRLTFNTFLGIWLLKTFK